MSKVINTKQKILKSAYKFFTRNGFSGTSMSMIASDAIVTQSLIHHHFKDKHKLWHAVKEEYVGKKYPGLILEFDHFKTIAEALDYYITLRFNFYLDNPEMVKLVSWQRLESTPETLLAKDAYDGKIKLIDFIRKQQKLGKVSLKLDAESVVRFIHPAISSVILDCPMKLKKDTKRIQKLLYNIKRIIINGVLNFEN